MQYSNQPTCISDRLFIPYDRLVCPFPFVDGSVGIFFHPERFVGFGDRENEEERTGGTGDEGEEIRIVDAEDVVEGEGGGKTELVDEGGHYFRVVFWNVAIRGVESNNGSRTVPRGTKAFLVLETSGLSGVIEVWSAACASGGFVMVRSMIIELRAQSEN